MVEQQLSFPLYAASRAVQQVYRPTLTRLGITFPQYLVLLVLWENDGQTVSEIGRRLHLDSGTLTPLLKRMEKARLVRRVRRKADERVVENHLTEAGRKLREPTEVLPKLLDEVLEPMGDEADRTRQVLMDMLTHLRLD